MNTYVKFGILVAVIIGTLGTIAVTGINPNTAAYYKSIKELGQMGPKAMEKRIRVGGDVERGSIQRNGRDVYFTLLQDNLKLKVVYSGIDPLPDTFRDGAQALADGRLSPDGVFHASKIEAKCASKYEAKPSDSPGRPQRSASM